MSSGARSPESTRALTGEDEAAGRDGTHRYALRTAAAPSDTPSNLSVNPSELVVSPSELVASPSELVASPSELLASPSELVASPSELVASPSELVASPSELVASPSELLASPSELLASPSELVASPSELLASPSKLCKAQGCLILLQVGPSLWKSSLLATPWEGGASHHALQHGHVLHHQLARRADAQRLRDTQGEGTARCLAEGHVGVFKANALPPPV
jgi:hypothetical protein